MVLLTNKTINIVKINIPTPSVISRRLLESIYLVAHGLTLGTNIIVITNAKSHFEADNKLKIKPFLKHWKIVINEINKYIKSKLDILFKIFSNIIYYFFSIPNGLIIKINFGNNVKTEIIANNIAIPVNIPK